MYLPLAHADFQLSGGDSIFEVRSGSQKSRSDFEAPLVKTYLKSLILKVEVTPLIFDYLGEPVAPLSWHLTPQQRLLVGKAWASENPDITAKHQEFYQALGCRANEE